MAVTVSNLTTGTDTDGDDTATTASISPSANKLLLLSVDARNTVTSQPNTPTVTGNGLTWVLVDSRYWDTGGSSRQKLFVFRAMGASPSAGVVTMDFGGENHTHITWVIDEFTGMDTTGTDGSGAIVQSVDDDGSGVTTLTVTLAAFSDAGNATFGAFAVGTSDTFTQGSGFAITGQQASAESSVCGEFRDDNDTSVDASWVNSEACGGVAIEIKVTPPATVVKDIISEGVVAFPR